MLVIKKGREPKSLTEYRLKSNAYFDGCNKGDIRKSLLSEQGYLCAYCMKRISENNMKIEHYNAQANISDSEALDYNNMIAVCNGNEGCGNKKELTCDSHKGNKKLTINPFMEESIELIMYNDDGTIYSNDKKIDDDLNKILNLNCEGVMLKRNRQEVLNKLKKYLISKKKSGNWSKNFLNTTLNKISNKDSEDKLTPYCGIAISYLKKKLK